MRPGRKFRQAVSLLEADRILALHDVVAEGDHWRATGRDPFLILRLHDGPVRGAFSFDLEIDAIQGQLQPRLYLQINGQWSQAASALMRRVGTGYYRIHAFVSRPLTAVRIDPAESLCAFRIRRFTARPVSLATFLARAMRGGQNRGQQKPKASRLVDALGQVARKGYAFETPKFPDRQIRNVQRFNEWIATNDYSPADEANVRHRLSQVNVRPKISVLMPTYNTPARILEEAIASVHSQIYDNWELCIADDCSPGAWVRPVLEEWKAKDPRIKVVYRTVNGHIAEATNSAFEIATGEYVALMDHDDVLRPHALAEVVLALAGNPQAQILYSDEDKIDDEGRRFDPYFKPHWNPQLLLGQNYFNHLTVHRAENIRKVGGWRKDYYGSQDYDINLRIAAHLTKDEIVHIPKILYHWRATRDSAASDSRQKNYAIVNAERALADFLSSQGIRGRIEEVPGTPWHRVRYDLPEVPPLVSLIIPTRNQHKVLKVCIDSIIEKTTYPNYEILVVDNNSDDPESLAYFRQIESEGRARVLRYPHPFNYSAINNFAVAEARGTIVGLVNNDIEVISPDWLSEMVSLAVRPGTGCVGAKLYYPNDTIQHAGIVLGIGGVAGHSHKYFERQAPGYFGRLRLVQNVSAVTGACLVVRKDIYNAVGGLDEVNLKVAFNDVDFCLKVMEAGYSNVFTPFAELYHHESLSRGVEDNPEKQARFASEIRHMQSRWGHILPHDPCYSPHLTLRREDFSINVD